MNRPVTKKTVSARINIALIDRLDKYINEQNNKGISTKKVSVIEHALLDFLEKNDKREVLNEEK